MSALDLDIRFKVLKMPQHAVDEVKGILVTCRDRPEELQASVRAMVPSATLKATYLAMVAAITLPEGDAARALALAEGEWLISDEGDRLHVYNLTMGMVGIFGLQMGPNQNTEQHEHQFLAFGRYYGYPECCVQFFDQDMHRLIRDAEFDTLDVVHARSEGFPCRLCGQHKNTSMGAFTQFVAAHRKYPTPEDVPEASLIDKLRFMSCFYTGQLQTPNHPTADIVSV